MKTKIEQGCTRIHSGVAWLGLKRADKNISEEYQKLYKGSSQINMKQQCVRGKGKG
jgi:hypothetical protein